MDTTLETILGAVTAGLAGTGGIPVSGVAYRSQDVRPGDVFFCIPGFSHDGHAFAADAVARGAAAVVASRPVAVDAPVVIVDDTRVALARAADTFYREPSAALDVFGITGTNGKTTSTYLLDSILRAAGHTTGLIGTVETRIADERQPATRTTPESADLHALFRRMLDSGVGACAIEVSSHAIDLRRVEGTRFAAVAFTNLTQDHLDFHHTLEEYYSVKKRLFSDFATRARVVDIDDPFGMGIAAEHPDALTVGRTGAAMLRALDERPRADGTTFTLVSPDGTVEVDLPLAGAYNVSNALCAAGCALAHGIGIDAVKAGLERAPQVPGRLERVECGQPFSVVVDYAHTPDSLSKAIAAVAAVTRGRVITVFGCGGDRDPDKRPMMGRAAGEGSDYTIITSDNPRSEDPVGIILQVEDGLIETGGAYEVVVDRREAISRAISMAGADDAVLIAGKGHEDYQIFADRTIHFDDRQVAREVLGAC